MTGKDAGGTAYYLYCLTPSGYALDLNLPDVTPAEVFALTCEGICAVLSEKSREEFCGEGADARLKDLAWLAPQVFRHEAVVEQVMCQAPVLPARFATLFTSLDSLRHFILEYRDAIHGFFTRLGDQREWAVKGLVDRALAGRAKVPEGQPMHSPGKNYLQKRRTEAEAGKQTSEWLRAACETAAGELEQQASAFRERQLWNGSDSDATTEVILNWAFLVRAGAEADFGRLVNRLDERHRACGLSFALSGPWPPYTFAPALGREAAGGETAP